MFAEPPKANRISIKSANCKKLVEFYSHFGMLFNVESAADNCGRYTYINDDFQFVILEVKNPNEATTNCSIRFLIDEIDGYLDEPYDLEIRIAKKSWMTDSHQHIKVLDPDGNLIELVTKKSKSA